ncbi:MAG: hypothetical protein QM495_03630 [Lutibacter sp.]|uniref:hypothetical protein n=1 Tax=Lutibacter sp. TaxID=1925666 RepID=UPI00385AEC6B
MKPIISIVLMFIFSNVFSQTAQNLDYRGKVVREYIIKRSDKIKGDNFIYNEWNDGMLVLNDSIFSKQNYLQYDVYKNRVLIKNMKNFDEIIEITDNSLTGFSILEKGRMLKHDFVKLKSNNFNSLDEGGFYEIVFNLENTNYFIKKNQKIVFDPNRSKGSQTENNFPLEFQEKVTYYIKNSQGLYVHVKLRKKSILEVLNANSKLVSSFIKAHKINFRKEGDIIKLVNYYYSL